MRSPAQVRYSALDRYSRSELAVVRKKRRRVGSGMESSSAVAHPIPWMKMAARRGAIAPALRPWPR